MPFVQLSGANLSFGPRTLLDNVDLVIGETTRAALCGDNGSGKSTLLKIICGEIAPDGGKVTVSRDAIVSYLPQSSGPLPDNTVWDFAQTAFERFFTLERRLRELETQMDTRADKAIAEHHELQEQLLDCGFYNRDSMVERVLLGLGFLREDFARPLSQFSGGWQMRAALSRVLLSRPHIMLLDEPTNYLDLETTQWLEKFLADWKGGLLMVSHDRRFLDSTVNEVHELFLSRLRIWKGNYSQYETRRQAELADILKRHAAQEEEIQKTEDFINRFRYNSSKASLVQSRVKWLEKLERIEVPQMADRIHFSFPPPPPCAQIILDIKNIGRSYGSKTVLSKLELTVNRGERLVVLGKNGAGKSTLLRILAQQDKNFEGVWRLGNGVLPAYFSQDMLDNLSFTGSVLDELERNSPYDLVPKLRGMLGAFLFKGDDVNKSLTVLSGGEKTRLVLLKMLLSPVNLLILDEPTNHLDIHSKDMLLDALSRYEGTVVFVSHDEYFIEKLATKVLYLENGAHRLYPGDYSYFTYRHGKESALEEDSGPKSAKPLAPSESSHEERKRKKNRLNALERREAELLSTIEKNDAHKKALEESLHQSEIYSDRQKAADVQKSMKALETENEKLMADWESLHEEKSALETEAPS